MSNQKFHEICEDLFSGVRQIYRQEEVMSEARFMKLYSYVYNVCTTTFVCDDDGTYTEYGGSQIYEKIEEFLVRYVTEIKENGVDKMDDDCLKFYANQWEKFKVSTSEVLNRLFAYLNRVWIQRQHDLKGYGCKADTRRRLIIEQLAFVTWRDTIIKSLDHQVINAVLKSIEKERRGESIDTRLINIVLDSYEAVGLDIGNYDIPTFENTGSDLAVPRNFELYRNSFENVFIAETARFYTLESVEFLSRHSITDYVKKVETRLKEEEKRLRVYLNAVTTMPLLETCQKILIADHFDILLTEFRDLIENGRRIEDLNRLFKLLARITGGMEKMSEIFEKHVTKNGALAIEKCGDLAANDPRTYVDTILKVHQTLREFAFNAFNNSSRMVQALDQGCTKFINDNYVTKADKSLSAKSAELLAKFCDALLKKSTKTSHFHNLEDTLDQTIIVLRYIEDKDMFQKFYIKSFAKRLVQKTSVSDDAELSMISKLRDCCGLKYTRKLQNMFKDVELNKTLNEQFKNQVVSSQEKNDSDFNVQVMTSGSWPFQQSCTLCLPAELEKSVQSFTSFYNGCHTGRKLHWIYQLSRGELIGNCFKNRYTFQVSCFQMAILLQYNNCDVYTVKQLEEITQMKFEYVIQVLQILIKSKLLSCDDGIDDLQPSSVIRLYTDYNNKKLRINLNAPLKVEVKLEQNAARRFIEEERNVLMQAAIVRTMKMRKTLDNQQLMIAVMKQLSSQFKPKPVAIKKNIDVLIEKYYLDRTTGEKECFLYKA